MEIFQRVRAIHSAVRTAFQEREERIAELTKERNDISAERGMMEKSAQDLARDLNLTVAVPEDDETEEMNDGTE